MKYELTDETHPDHPTLYRIRARRDIPERGVKSGDLGGWVESESNLSPSGAAWVSGDAQVSGEAWVYGDAWVFGTAQVYGTARVSGTAWVFGDAQVYGDAWVYGGAQVYGDAWVFGTAQVSGNALVYGGARVSGTARVFGDAQVYGDAWVSGDAWVFDDARVYVARHVSTVGPVGSEDRTATIYRDKDGTARIVAGCWTGTPNELAERITDAWLAANPTDRKAWASDYTTVIKLARRREKEWNK